MIKNFHTACDIIILGLLALSGVCFSAEEFHDIDNVDIQRAWFKPKLTVNADPICNTLLLATRTKFLSLDSQYGDLVGFTRISGPFQNNKDSNSGIQFLEDDPRQFIFTSSSGSKLFGDFMNIGGCGGGCETEKLLISDEKFPAGAPADRQSTASTPAAPGWSLLKDHKDSLYAQGIVDGHSQLFRIVSPKNWHLSCDIALKPDNLQESNKSEVQAVVKEIKALITVTGGLSRGAGNCGSMGTAWRWQNNVKENLYETIYRPWTLSAWKNDRFSENSFGDYTRIEEQLKLWSLGGLDEYRDFKLYQKQLAKTIKALTNFYIKQFGFSSTSSLRMARRATTNAISLSFGFYMFDPYPLLAERQLRAAILEHKPMSKIRATQFDGLLTDFSKEDSILDVAVEYPEALHYLLDKGANPNVSNEFGKTPLMYASQANQLEAVKLLLAAGAYANAATTQPLDTCKYTIETTHMTALHYAARYASVPLINLLIDGGAVTFSQSYNPNRQFEYPLDWLQRYVITPTEIERNPNILPTDVKRAANLLRVPNDKERDRIAENMVIRAESDYSKGKPKSAYRYLQIAIAAQPNNQKAISDLPIVALKAGEIGPAIKSANQAIEVLKVPTLLASAWFNKGIICAQVGADLVYYDGNRCDEDLIQPFVRAWQLGATSARTNKLKGFFNKDDLGVCEYSVPQSASSIKVRILRNPSHQRIYILHRAEQEIAPAAIQWSITFYDHPESPELKVITPILVDRIILDGEAITVFEGTSYGQYPTISGEAWCEK